MLVRTTTSLILKVVLAAVLAGYASALQSSSCQPPKAATWCTSTQLSEPFGFTRRSALVLIPVVALSLPSLAFAAKPNGLPLSTTPSGLKWADAKTGTGQPVQKGTPVSIDYAMASTAGRFPQIYSTKDKGAPYRWILGDGSTIAGIERAILGDEAEGIPPMLPGGVRRVTIPASLGFQKLSSSGSRTCMDHRNSSLLVGPIPPNEDGAFMRWAEFYCNPQIPYQPDLIVDIKLYGKR